MEGLSNGTARSRDRGWCVADDAEEGAAGEVLELEKLMARRVLAVRRRGRAWGPTAASGFVSPLSRSCLSAMACRRPSKRAVRLPIEPFASVAAGKSKLPDMVDKGIGRLREEGLVMGCRRCRRCGGLYGRGLRECLQCSLRGGGGTVQ
jgi:hypothetical protein